MKNFLPLILTIILLCGGGGKNAWAIGDQPDDYSQPLNDIWVNSMRAMAEQASVMMEAQVQAFGMFLDAKHQLETQRLFQEKLAEAHKDYHPSEQVCTMGTFVRDLYQTEERNAITRTGLVQFMQQRETGNGDNAGRSALTDRLSRLLKYRSTFCNQSDNAGGLATLCPDPTPIEMRNRDIDYTVTVDRPLSLDVNLSDTAGTNDEEAIFALLNNLFSHRQPETFPVDPLGYNYADYRSVVAMRGVARSSIANIIALKTAAPDAVNTSTGPYMRALMREFGMDDGDINGLLGENPSYYAQMELLTKKIYQSPTFYTNLYDKPANVQRLRAAMKAVKLMQDRDIHAAFLRREMLMAMLLEVRLRNESDKVYSATERAIFNARPIQLNTP